MTKEQVVKVANKAIQGTLSLQELGEFLVEYCVERGKPFDISVTFISIVLNRGLVSIYFKEALDWYLKKYLIIGVETEALKPNSGGEVLLYV